MPTTMVRVVSVFGISYIRFQLLVLSFQFVTMVAHLLRFAKHVRLDWSSYMRRRTPLTIPHRKRHVFLSTGAVIASQGTILPLGSVFIVYWFLLVTHILYAVWCCPARREGRQSRLVAMQSRHWLFACAVGTLQDPYRPCRCVPIRCNTCQSYSYSYSVMRTFATFPDIIV